MRPTQFAVLVAICFFLGCQSPDAIVMGGHGNDRCREAIMDDGGDMCLSSGRCSYADTTQAPRFGCKATSNEDCRLSDVCKSSGQCTATDGECVATEADCERLDRCRGGKCRVFMEMCEDKETIPK